jgi:DNA-binding NtrC family response regulator
LPPALQAKLLRVLQEREIDRLGGARPVPVDLRVIATSNRDLALMVERKQFRADLYYRLFVFPIVLPPLRQRPDDVPALCRHLLGRLAEGLGRPAPSLTAEAIRALREQRFPGNVRELGNVLERALVRCRLPVLDRADLDLGGGGRGDAGRAAALLGRTDRAPLPERRFLPEGVPIDLASLERMAIQEALRRMRGNRTHAARLLGISLRTLRNKLRGYRAEGTGAYVAADLAPADSTDGQRLPDGAGGGGDDIDDAIVQVAPARGSHPAVPGFPEKEHVA